MPTFLAVQCYSCSTFQVIHDKKSSNKFSCAICHEKQSIRKVLCSSEQAKDVRVHVQKLNMKRGEASSVPDYASEEEYTDECMAAPVLVSKEKSKWADYCDDQEEDAAADEPEDDPRFVTVLPDRKSGGRGGGGRQGEGKRQRHEVDDNDREAARHPSMSNSNKRNMPGNCFRTEGFARGTDLELRDRPFVPFEREHTHSSSGKAHRTSASAGKDVRPEFKFAVPRSPATRFGSNGVDENLKPTSYSDPIAVELPDGHSDGHETTTYPRLGWGQAAARSSSTAGAALWRRDEDDTDEEGCQTQTRPQVSAKWAQFL